MKILWVKSDFLHPARGGGQIRTLETLKRLRQRHEIHFAALDLPQPGFGLRRLLNLQLWGDLFLTGRREQVWTPGAARA